MVKVVLSPEASRDLFQIGDYISFTLHNKAAARKLIGRLRDTMRILEKFPESGTLLDDTQPHILYRYLVCGNYLIFYHLSGECACIDRILYGRRDYMMILFGDQLREEAEREES